MDNQGVIWAYRFILNREPESQEAIAVAAGAVSTPLELRRLLRKSREFNDYLERAGDVFTTDAHLDWREGITWAYRLLLDREPSDRELGDALARDNSVNDVRLRLLLTSERATKWPGLEPLADFSIINAFAPFPARSPVADAFVDFLGSATRVRYLDGPSQGLAGYVYRGVPRDREAGHHGTSEWIGTLRSVLEGNGRFTAMELGAGWAPWLVVARRAAELQGITDLDLTGVEASEEHYHYMLDHVAANGIDPDSHALHRAVAAAEDGVALFPRLHNSDDYGANAAFDEQEATNAARFGDLEEIQALSLNTLLRGKTRVDLIHIDIQGHEEDVIRSGIEALNATTRRMVIGTHSRTIDGHLMDLLHANGWVCESEIPCKLARNQDGRLQLVVDGEQVWRNDRIPVISPRLAEGVRSARQLADLAI